MKIKTSELTGPALDWAVAKCEGIRREPISGSDTLLVAMRCFVSSKLGDEIDVPEELL